MPTVPRDDVSIYYETMGDGPPVVLGHSFLCSGEMWSPQVEPLAERYRVINIDLRGHGRSGTVDRPFSLYDLVDDVLAVLDHLGIERAVWAGLSISGMVALRAALVARERVSGLILVDTHAGAETFANKIQYPVMVAAARVFGTARLMPRVARMFFCAHTRNTRPELVEEWKERFSSVFLSSIAHTISALKPRESIVGRLGEIDVPAVVIVGKEDQPLPVSCSREIAVGLGNASLVEIEDCGHLSSLEQPEAVTSAMLSFLEDLREGVEGLSWQ